MRRDLRYEPCGTIRGMRAASGALVVENAPTRPTYWVRHVRREATVSRSVGLHEPVPVDRCGTLGREGGRSHRMPCEPAPSYARPPEPTGVVRRGLVAAPSVLHDGVPRDEHHGPIAESRHAAPAGRGGDSGPARAVPVLDPGTDGPDVAGGDRRDRRQALRRVGDAFKTRAIPVVGQSDGAATVAELSFPHSQTF